MRNLVILVGRLTRDVEVRTMNNGKEVALFSLATSESYKDKQTGERENIPEYHSIVVYNEGLIGIIKKYIKKGSLLYIEGSIKTKKYVDKNGIEKYKTEIVLQNYKGRIQMLDSKNSDQSSPNKNLSTAEQVKKEFKGATSSDSDSSGFGGW